METKPPESNWQEFGTFELYDNPTDFEIVCPCCCEHDVPVILDDDHVARIVIYYFREHYAVDFATIDKFLHESPRQIPRTILTRLIDSCVDCPFEYDCTCTLLNKGDYPLNYEHLRKSPPEKCPLRNDDVLLHLKS